MSTKQKQLNLLSLKKYHSRKTARAIGIRETNHVVMKAIVPVLRLQYSLVKTVIRETQERYGVKLYALAIMEDHLHFLIQVPSRKAFADSMKFLASRIALRMGMGRLWMKRCWSRLVRWGRDFLGARRYIDLNPMKAGCWEEEVDGFRICHGTLIPD